MIKCDPVDQLYLEWIQNHDEQNICVFDIDETVENSTLLPDSLNFTCGPNDDGQRILGCKSLYDFVLKVRS